MNSGPTVSRGDHSENNLDFLRLLFALAVLYSHSFPLVTGQPQDEPLLLWSRGRCTLGDLAVTFFFVVSGYLITSSYLFGGSLMSYLAKRALRIFPGYFAAAFVCVAVVAPLASTANDNSYIAHLTAQTLSMEPLWAFHVFDTNPLPGYINGSVWTIKYEVGCYLLVPLIGAAGLLRRPTAALLLLAFVSLLFVTAGSSQTLNRPYFPFGEGVSWLRFVRQFLIGVNLYLWRGYLAIRFRYFVLAICIAILSIHIPKIGLSKVVIDASSAYAIYCLAFARWLPFQRFGRFGDFSYGTYLYAWPVQQLLIWYSAVYPELGLQPSPRVIFVTAAVISVALAIVSWYLIESPFLRLKRRLACPNEPTPCTPAPSRAIPCPREPLDTHAHSARRSNPPGSGPCA